MREYRELRARVGFLDLCKRSDLAAEITVKAVEKLKVDAAIIFADILLPLEPMGVGLSYGQGEGPKIKRPVRSGEDVAALSPLAVEESLHYVLDAIRLARQELPPAVPLIGFAGAPFTLASYLIEGGSSRHFEQTKRFMYTCPEGWRNLMELLCEVTAAYLGAQAYAGVQAVQIFDSWVGCLNQDDYREFVLPYTRRLIERVPESVPLIHFGTGTGHLLESMREAGGDVIGLDWRVNLDEAWRRIGYDVAVQGNLDPAVLLADPPEIKKRAAHLLGLAGGRAGHIFNLGHGVLPETPFDHVRYLVEVVHELGGAA